MRLCIIGSSKSIHLRIILKNLSKKYEVFFITNDIEKLDGSYLKNVSHLQLRWSKYIPNFVTLRGKKYVNPIIWLSYPLIALELRSIIKRLQPDVVHAFYITSYGVWAALTGFNPLFVTIFGSDLLIDPMRYPLARYLVSFVFKRSAAITCNSRSVLKKTIEFGCKRNQIHYFHWGIDLNKLCISDMEKVRELLGWKDNLIVLCTRMHEEVYGIKYLLYAMPEIIREIPHARFLFVGSGSLTNKFMKIVQDLRYENYVRFVGYKPHEEVIKFLKASDVYVCSSLSDAASISLQEAMACQLACITTDVEGKLEWIQNNVNGLVVPKKNVKALADGIIQLLKNEGMRIRLGINAYETVQSNLNRDKNFKVLDQLYKNL